METLKNRFEKIAEEYRKAFFKKNEETVKFNITNKQVGIDLGVKDFVITSDGEVFQNEHFFKKQEKKIMNLKKN